MKKYVDYLDNISVNAEQHGRTMERLKQKPTTRRQSRTVYRYAGLAACAVILIFCVWTIPGLLNTPIDNTPGNPNGNVRASQQTDPTPAQDEAPDGPHDRIPDPEPDYGLMVPAIELPDNTDGVEYDMIGLFVYQRKIYTQAGWYYNDDVIALGDIVGERIGYATGNINEWSTQDDYAVEFAGSARGDVYTVNGYDPSFRLCMKGEYYDDDGHHVIWLNFYENLNDIGLTYGVDLFGDSFGRLRIRDKWVSVQYQEHDNWNWSSSLDYVYHDLTAVSDENIQAFIDELYNGKFEYVWDLFWEHKYYDTLKQAHLLFHMNDGTVIRLRLYEGGYVGYEHLFWYFVKIPGEVFDTVFNACQ